jgi:hypothetical protein
VATAASVHAGYTSLRVQPVEPVGQVVQLLREQVPVAVQGDRRRLVAQVMLHRLDARSLADQQTRAGTAKVMYSEGGRQTSGPGGRLEVPLSELRLPKWAFTVMGLHNILLVTFSWNLPAIRAYTKAGFREIGRRRGAVVTYGQRYDQVLMDAVADEFTDLVLAKQAPPNTESPGRP